MQKVFSDKFETAVGNTDVNFALFAAGAAPGATLGGSKRASDDFQQYVTGLATKLGTDKLKSFGKNAGFVTKNLVYLNKVKESKIDLESVCEALSNEFENSSQNIERRDIGHYQKWRNDYIIDTLEGMTFSKTNRDFIALILALLFKSCFDEFDTYDFAEFDGRKRRSASKKRKRRDPESPRSQRV